MCFRSLAACILTVYIILSFFHSTTAASHTCLPSYHQPSLLITICHYLSRPVTTCLHDLCPRPVTTCHDLSRPVTTCRDLSLSITTRHYPSIYPSSRENGQVQTEVERTPVYGRGVPYKSVWTWSNRTITASQPPIQPSTSQPASQPAGQPASPPHTHPLTTVLSALVALVALVALSALFVLVALFAPNTPPGALLSSCTRPRACQQTIPVRSKAHLTMSTGSGDTRRAVHLSMGPDHRRRAE